MPIPAKFETAGSLQQLEQSGFLELEVLQYLSLNRSHGLHISEIANFQIIRTTW
jgi:hypothetical protein